MMSRRMSNLSKSQLLYRQFSTSSSTCGKFKRKLHWAEELRRKSNCDRALDHFDDFYSSVYGPKKWASLRLGLLSPTKYMAIPNSFTGNMEQISSKLETLGAFSVQKMWEAGRQDLLKEKKQFDLKKDLGRIHELEKKLESIAVTKHAEEMEVMYQNAPDKKAFAAIGQNRQQEDQQRVFNDPSQATFVPPTKLKGADEFAFDSEYYAGYLPSSINSLLNQDQGSPFAYTKPNIVSKISFPQYLQPYTFEPGSAQAFSGSGRDSSTGLREYLCVNGGSIAPILALDLKPDSNLLDLCSGPGTKSLMAIITMSLQTITCNDVDSNRVYRVKKIFKEFLGSESPDLVTYTKYNGMNYPAVGEFSRVLADVPCLSDKTACIEPDNNIFKPTRTKERLNLVKVQQNILLSALKAMTKQNGSVTVYSTCTLSPVENDGVVMQALKETQIPNLTVDLFGLLDILRPFEKYSLFKLSRTRLGVLIEPTVFSNFGPMYISRIVVDNQKSSLKETESEA